MGQLANKRCLVTGGKGFIGSHLVQALLAEQSEVVVLDIEAPEIPAYFTIHGLQDEIRYIQGNITSESDIMSVFASFRIDYVFHLAAQPITPLSNENPDMTYAVNVGGTGKLCNAISNLEKKPNLVFASSACFYGVPKNSPLSEEDKPILSDGHSVYTVSKIRSEELIKELFRKKIANTSICRFVNVYGPGDRHASRIIPKTVKALLENRRPTLLRSKGESIFSYMFVKDAVNALMSTAENMDKYPGEIFNFGLLGDNPRSIRCLISDIYKVFGREPEDPLVLAENPEPIVRKFLDPTKAIDLLGWNATTHLYEGLQRTVEWEKKYTHYIKSFEY